MIFLSYQGKIDLQMYNNGLNLISTNQNEVPDLVLIQKGEKNNQELGAIYWKQDLRTTLETSL